MVALAVGGGTIGMSIDPAGFDGLTLQHDVAAAAWLEPFVWDTASPGDAFIGLWEGYGGLEPPAGLPLVHLPPEGDMRRYMLLRGAVSAGASMMPHPSGHAPDLMWPADRAWMLATDASTT